MSNSMKIPTESRSVCLAKSANGPHHYDAVIRNVPIPELKEGQILVRMGAAAFNHREVWQLKNQYPQTTENTIMGADGAGVVVAAFDPADSLLRKKVLLVPIRGWESDPIGPEDRLVTLGGIPLGGTFTEFLAVDRRWVTEVPEYLPLVYAAAWPIAGLTAWRAIKVKANVQPGDNVLITGIGGGVALTALQLCIAMGANVFVTTSSLEKLGKAQSLGAIGGVDYKSEKWPVELGKILDKSSKGTSRKPLIDVVIDSAGGPLIAQLGKLLAPGARVVVVGMTAQPKMSFTMLEVLRNIELKGSTLGSRQEFLDSFAFMTEKRIFPEVSHVLRGLDEVQEGFKLLESGSQIGKVVIKFPGRTPDGEARL